MLWGLKCPMVMLTSGYSVYWEGQVLPQVCRIIRDNRPRELS